MSLSDLLHCAMTERSVLKEILCCTSMLISFLFSFGLLTTHSIKVLRRKLNQSLLNQLRTIFFLRPHLIAINITTDLLFLKEKKRGGEREKGKKKKKYVFLGT